MLKFIPPDDPADTAADAAELTSLDFGPVFVGSTASRSFRLGNLAAEPVNYSFELDYNGFPPDSIEVPPPGTIQADGFTDTMTIRVTPTPDCGNAAWTLALRNEPEQQGGLFAVGTGLWPVLRVMGGEEPIELQLTFTSVADRDSRRNEFATRSTSQTNVFSNAIDRTCEWFQLLRFDPIPYDPDLQSRIIVEPGERELDGDAGNYRFRSIADPCERLNPSNPEWGYHSSATWIRAHWHPEVDSLTESFTFGNTMMTYESTASIIIPAPYHEHLQRSWALFAPANGADKEQYKRTVFLLKRNDELWAIQDVVLPPLGDRMAYCEAKVIQVHNPGSSTQFYNPFAITYEHESDKPYRMYPCQCLFDWALVDEYGIPDEGQ